MCVWLLVGAYLSGSIPFSLLTAYLWKGVDLRHTGSGNPGGMNTMRSVGLVPGLIGGLLDVLKGFLPVWVARSLQAGEWGPPLVGAAAVLGHCYSLYLILLYLWEVRSGRESRLPWWVAQPRLGGKGLGTGAGGLLALSWPTLLITGAIFGLMTFLFRRQVSGSPVVARSTTVALLIAPAILWTFERSLPPVVGGVLMALIALLKHIPYLELGPNWPNAHLERAADREGRPA